jgi:NADH/NAD ratio-sensing transcriptional regulator Rex
MRPTVWLGAVRLVEREATRQALEAVHCQLVGLFDDGGERRAAGGLPVQPLASAPREVRKHQATVAVLAAEEAARPERVRELVAAGIRAVLNLTAAPLPPCAQAVVEQGDLRSQLARLLSRFSAGGEVAERRRVKDRR